MRPRSSFPSGGVLERPSKGRLKGDRISLAMKSSPSSKPSSSAKERSDAKSLGTYSLTTFYIGVEVLLLGGG